MTAAVVLSALFLSAATLTYRLLSSSSGPTQVVLSMLSGWLSKVLQWVVFSVVLAFVPIAASWLFLPAGATAWDAIGHGELAVLAQALAGGSLGVLLADGRDRPSFQLLLVLNGAVLVVGLLILIAIVGESPQFPHDDAVRTSLWLLALAVLTGAVSNVRLRVV